MKAITRVRAVYIAGGIAAISVVATFVWNFHGHAPGQPEAWGQFGDYMGGVLNPILSFFTVVLLVEALIAERRDADSAKREALIRLHIARLDSVRSWYDIHGMSLYP